MHAALEFVQPRVDLGLELGGRDDHLEFPLKTCGGVSVTCIEEDLIEKSL